MAEETTEVEVYAPPSQIEDRLGAGFWVQPETAIAQAFSAVYSNFAEALRQEVRERGGSAIEFALAERLAANYAILRQREADDTNPITDRTRREMNKDFIEFSLALKKIWAAEDKADQSAIFLKKLDKAVFDAVQGLPEDQRKTVQLALADSFDAAGL